MRRRTRFTEYASGSIKSDDYEFRWRITRAEYRRVSWSWSVHPIPITSTKLNRYARNGNSQDEHWCMRRVIATLRNLNKPWGLMPRQEFVELFNTAWAMSKLASF